MPERQDLQHVLKRQLNDRPEHVSHRDDPHAYASEALSCARQLALRIWHRADPVPERESKLSGLLSLRIGEFLHLEIQKALLVAYPHCQNELGWDLPFTSGRCDAVYELVPGDPSTRRVVEIKSMNDRMFKRALKTGKPDVGHLMQAMLGAVALKAPEVHIIYVSKASRPHEEAWLEWILPIDLEATELEIERMATIVQEAEKGIIPQPFYQGKLITNPDKEYWPCGFCRFREECRLIGPSKVHLYEVHRDYEDHEGHVSVAVEISGVADGWNDPLVSLTEREIRELRPIAETLVQEELSKDAPNTQEAGDEHPEGPPKPPAKRARARKPKSKAADDLKSS